MMLSQPLKKIIFSLMIMFISLVTVNRVCAETSYAYEIKAVYILRLASFISWPNEYQLSNISYCAIGDNELVGLISEKADGYNVRNKDIVFRKLESVAHTKGCQVVYVSPEHSDFTLVDENSGVVLVSDEPRYASQGGMIELRQRDNRVIPIINIDKVRRSSVKVSSQLLRIATLVSTPELSDF